MLFISQRMVSELKNMSLISRKFSPLFHVCKPGHRPQEHIFNIKSVIGKYNMEKKVIIMIRYKISGFFDKEVLSDAVQELYSINTDPKVCIRLFHKLNESTRVRVRTSCGYSE